MKQIPFLFSCVRRSVSSCIFQVRGLHNMQPQPQPQPDHPVQILSKKLINPASPTPHDLRNMKISSLDQFSPTLYVPFVFYYPATDHKYQKAENAVKSKQLEKSLSEVLTIFYPLAGRYIKDNLLIDCNDFGVEYLEAQVSGKLAPLLKRNFDSNKLNYLIPCQSESPTSPLVAVQFNMFECGGLAIGLCISHKIIDGYMLSKFVCGWATACRVGIDKLHRPNFDLASLLPARKTMPEISPVPRWNPDVKTASRTFAFNGLAISELRAIVKDGSQSQPSRYQMVTTLIWKALIRVAQAKHGRLRPAVITQTMNLRGRTVLQQISEDCCGNLIRPITARFMPNVGSDTVELHDLVNLVGDSVRNGVTDCAKPQTGDDLFLMVTDAWREAGEEFDKDEVEAYLFTSLCGMPFYPDFGWGKPVRVSHAQSRVELILLMDTSDGNGIEAWICLDEEDMLLFQQDPDIIALTSQEDDNHRSTESELID